MRKFAALLLCSFAVLAADAPRRAPGFCLMDQRQQWQDLADYRGKVVIVEFMQSTCPHCAALVTVLEDLSKKYAGRLQVISIAVAPDPPQQVVQFAVGHKLTYPLLYDGGQVAASYTRTGGINFPAVYVVDREGMMRDHWEYGPLTKDVFEGGGLGRAVERLMVGAPAGGPAKK